MRGGTRPSLSRNVISPRLFGRQTLKMKVKPGHLCRPSRRLFDEKFRHWYCRSATGADGEDLQNIVASVAPTASWPVPSNSHSSASFADLTLLITASLSVSVALVLNAKLAR